MPPIIVPPSSAIMLVVCCTLAAMSGMYLTVALLPLVWASGYLGGWNAAITKIKERLHA